MRRTAQLAAMLVTFCAVRAGAQFSVQPVIVRATPVDSPTVAVITVRNQSTTERQYAFSMSDFDQDIDGGHSFRPFGTNRSSCRGHVRVSPEASTLQAGERVDVRVWIDPVETECWAVLLVDEQARTPKRGLRAGSQIAVKLYVTTPRSSFDADILSVTAANDSAGVHAVFEMRNLGTAPVRPNGRAEIRAVTGETLAAAEIEAFSILPGHTRRMSVSVNRQLAPGSYLVVPILDFGGAFLAGGQGRLTIR